jgi:DNA repair protein RadC
MEKYKNHTTIRSWAEDDRPREKFILKGRQSLSDAELLAILISSGTKEESAVDLAKKILSKANGTLHELSRFTVQELIREKGIGMARAIAILAALELGRRRNESDAVAREKIKSSKDAFEIFRSTMGDKPYEEFWILMLNKGNRLIRKHMVSEGGIAGTVVDPKKVFKICIDHHATAIILGHNHPSGNIAPSESDIKLTKNLLHAGKLLDISVLDHLIVCDNAYYSFGDEGILN